MYMNHATKDKPSLQAVVEPVGAGLQPDSVASAKGGHSIQQMKRWRATSVDLSS